MKEDTITVTGIVDFDYVLLCKRDILGSFFPINISGYSGTLQLPNLPKKIRQDDRLPFLSPPEIVKTWQRGNKDIYYGKVVSYPDFDSHITRAAVNFLINRDELDAASQEIYHDIERWNTCFIQHLTITTRRSLRSVIQSDKNQLELHQNEPTQILKRIPSRTIFSITINLPSEDNKVDKPKFIAAATFASNQRPLKIEYYLLCRAYDELKLGNYRSAIIESTAGLDIALTQYIKRNWNNDKFTFDDKIPEKKRTLGKLFEALKFVDNILPDADYQSIIVKPRNDIVHRAYFPDENDARTIIDATAQVLELISPEIEDFCESNTC